MGRSNKQVNYSLPPAAIAAIEELWRFHRRLDGSLADNRSEYVADLVLRDLARVVKRDTFEPFEPFEPDALTEAFET